MNFSELLKSSVVGNFYIFLTILGLTLLYWSVTYPENQLDTYSAKFNEIQRDKRLLRLEQNIEFEHIVHDHRQRTGTLKHFAKSSIQELRDEKGITAKGLELEKRKIDIAYRTEDAEREFKKISSNQIIYNLLTIISLTLLFSGCAGWLWRTQYFEDQKQKQATGIPTNDWKSQLKTFTSFIKKNTYKSRSRRKTHRHHNKKQ